MSIVLRVLLLGLSIVLLRLSEFLLVPIGSPQCQNKLGEQDYGLQQRETMLLKASVEQKVPMKSAWLELELWVQQDIHLQISARAGLHHLFRPHVIPCRKWSGQNTLLKIFCSHPNVDSCLTWRIDMNRHIRCFLGWGISMLLFTIWHSYFEIKNVLVCLGGGVESSAEGEECHK